MPSRALAGGRDVTALPGRRLDATRELPTLIGDRVGCRGKELGWRQRERSGSGKPA
jgi:hypothetical protein